MTITCPHCGFSRSTDPNRVPDGPARVTCPQCRHRFSLSAAEQREGTAAPGIEPAAPQQPSPTEPTPPEPPPEPQPVSGVRAEPHQLAGPAAAAATPKAGFWVRAVAAIIDSVLVTVVQMVCGLAFGVAAGALGALARGDQSAIALTTWLFGTVLAIAYYVFFTGYCGQTPGKMAVRVKVIRTDGTEIGYGRAGLREVPGKFISGILFGIGYLMVAFDTQKQGLHDKMADTYVIKL